MDRIALVTTKTPLRIGFAGGGTDLPAFYEQEDGAVLSATINKYLYVTVKRHSRLFLENYRLSYSETEHVEDIGSIKNGIARECLRLVKVDTPIYINTIADLPGSSGLGSSSSFAVGLLNALHNLNGNDVSAAQLAEEACHIELEVLKKPIGKQDQYAAAFGGLNHFFFHQSGNVTLDPKHLPDEKIERFFRSIQLFWTGITRSADSVLKEQQAITGTKMEQLRSMRDSSHALWKVLANGGDLKVIGDILSAGWKNKRSLTSGISSSKIDEWYTKAMATGALGGKLLGAGGGGFLLFVTPDQSQEKLRTVLGDLSYTQVRYESRGSQVIYMNRE